MKLKLDENLGQRGLEVLAAAGHEVCTVAQQGLVAATDRELLERCTAEGRVLVTLDLDFANPLIFPPVKHAGVAVLRLPRRPSAADLEQAVKTLASALRTQSPERRLWIVELARVRVYLPGS